MERNHAKRLYDAFGFSVRPLQLQRMSAGTAREVFDYLNIPIKRGAKDNNDIALQRKLWRARRIVRWLAHLPFVRAVAVCNSLAFQTVHENSDIDLFIVAASGRVWSARAWVTGGLALLRLRPGEARRDPVCASFFVDESMTDLGVLKISRDVYFYFWERTLLPMMGEHVLFANGAGATPLFLVTPNTWLKNILEKLAAGVSEKFIRHQQEQILPSAVINAQKQPDTGVVMTDKIIKLHVQDRRTEFRDFVFGANLNSGL